jgi:hypothetical protein
LRNAKNVSRLRIWTPIIENTVKKFSLKGTR